MSSGFSTEQFFLLKQQLHQRSSIPSVTGAWILSGGTHAGVMKHVGRAVRDYNLSSNAVGGQIVAIGVATWGVIHKRQDLVHPNVNIFSNHLTRFLNSVYINIMVQQLLS